YEHLGRIVSVAMYVAINVWLFYVALEPYVRRFWPQLLIGWTRALSGGLRDPLVGRDILAGVAAGTVGAVLIASRVLIPPEFGLLSLIVTIYTFLAIEAFPLTLDLSRPYAGSAWMVCAAVAALSLFGFYASRGGEPLLGRTLLD